MGEAETGAGYRSSNLRWIGLTGCGGARFDKRFKQRVGGTITAVHFIRHMGANEWTRRCTRQKTAIQRKTAHLARLSIHLWTLLAPYWCREQESNLRPTDYESVALPTELSRPRGANYRVPCRDEQCRQKDRKSTRLNSSH